MGMFDNLFRSFQAQETVPRLSSDFRPSQATPNVYTPVGYSPLAQVPQQVQNLYSLYAPPTDINMDSISAYGRQISGQRPSMRQTPAQITPTSYASNDTLRKLETAKGLRAANVLNMLAEGKKVGLPALMDAKSTLQLAQNYLTNGGSDAVSGGGSSTSGPSSSSSAGLGALGEAMGSHSMANLGEALSAYGNLGIAPGSFAAAAIGGALSDAASEMGFGIGQEGMAGIDASATEAGSFGLGAMGSMSTGFGIGAVDSAIGDESVGFGSEGEGEGDGDGDGGDGDGGDGDGGGDGGDGGDGGGGDGGGGGERAGGLIDKQRKAAQAYKRGEITFKELCRILA